MSFAFVADYIGVLALATALTIALSLVAFIGGAVVGSLIAFGRLLGGHDVDLVLGGFVDLIRGTPLLVQLLIWYLVPTALGIEASPFTAAALGLSINAGAFISEILRGGLASIHKGQREAALALGLSPVYSLAAIEFPQALPAIVPAFFSFYIGLVKDTSIAFIVGLHELTRAAKLIAEFTFKPLEIYLVVAVIYFALCYPLSRLVPIVERRFQRSGAVYGRLSV